MYTLISLFYVSLIIMIVMIWWKRHEVKSGKPSLVSRLGQGSDHVFSAVFSSVGRFFSYINKHTFIALAHWIAFHVLVHLRKIYVEIKHRFISHPQGKRMMDAIRGRGEVRHHGASFYLRKISGHGK